MTGAGGPLVVGVLNVTPDSFSDGGRYTSLDTALAHGRSLVADGADLVEVGGESTRPGAAEVPVEEESRRTTAVVRHLVAEGVAVAIDTRSSRVAAAALEAGATLVNDVSGGTADPAILDVVAHAGCDCVLMHSRGPAGTDGGYRDVVADVAADLAARVAAARSAGVADARLAVDPGIGFSKTAAESWRLLADLDSVRVDGLRMMVGVSRKRFLGRLLPDGAPVEERDPLTSVLSALLAQQDVWALRVHDVLGTRRALAVLQHLREAG